MLAYIIGQLGGLVPLPGGAGGLDLGLIGALVLGLPALASLRRRLREPESQLIFCAPGETLESL